MNPELAVDIFKTTIMFALYVVAPFLGVTLVVGLLASLVQSISHQLAGTDADFCP